MKKKITFVTVDGKQFDNEDDCKNYEKKLLQQGFLLWDCNGDPVSNLDNASYIKFLNEKGIDWFVDIYFSPWSEVNRPSIGHIINMREDSEFCWCTIDTQIGAMERQLKILKSMQ